ncbi:MAG: TlpA family protein disulfide reductase [Weeksellaceae bacterium]
MSKYVFICSFFLLFINSCAEKERSHFPPAALEEKVEGLAQDTSYTIEEILKQHQGQNVIIEIWASWCADCIKAMPKVAKFQEENPEVKFIFISVDEESDKWKNGIHKYMKRFGVQGEHYHFTNGWDRSGDNAFINFIGLDWIPRYMLVGKDGQIIVYYAKSIEDKNISKNLSL